MLPKKNRVTKELFQILMKEGKVLSGPFFLFRYIPSIEPHYAFVAPKSAARGAVLRNRLRRVGYTSLSSFPITSGSGIFFYKKEGIKANSQEIKQGIGDLLKKSKIL